MGMAGRGPVAEGELLLQLLIRLVDILEQRSLDDTDASRATRPGQVVRGLDDLLACLVATQAD